jgi:molecular chaperone DnaK (HSP70)
MNTLFLLILQGLLASISANVIGIDFGGDNMKVAVVSPGSPFDIGKIYNNINPLY